MVYDTTKVIRFLKRMGLSGFSKPGHDYGSIQMRALYGEAHVVITVYTLTWLTRIYVNLVLDGVDARRSLMTFAFCRDSEEKQWKSAVPIQVTLNAESLSAD